MMGMFCGTAVLFSAILTVGVSAASGAEGMAHDSDVSVKIGVLAKWGTERCLEQWGATAEYLSSQIPGHSFTIVPLGFNEIGPVAERGEVDFIVAGQSKNAQRNGKAVRPFKKHKKLRMLGLRM